MNRLIPSPPFPCGQISRRRFLADAGMGFTGLALGSRSAWSASAPVRPTWMSIASSRVVARCAENLPLASFDGRTPFGGDARGYTDCAPATA